MFNFNLYLSAKRTNAHGMAPMYAKILLNNKYYDRSSGIYINPQHWDKQFKRVNPKDSTATATNQLITEFENKLFGFRSQVTSIHNLDTLLKGNNEHQTRPLLLHALDAYLSHQEKRVNKQDGITWSTYKTYTYKKCNFELFLKEIGKQSLYVDEFNANIGDRFKSWLYAKDFERSHVNKHLLFARTLIKYAHYEFGTSQTNFLNVPIKKGETKEIVYLTQAEVGRIQTHVYLSSLMQKTADLLLLQCFTGMGYSDVIRFTDEMIETHHGRKFVHYTRQKTKVKGIVPLHPQVIAILKRNGGKAPKLANQTYNPMLKELGALTTIDKTLTTHVGRKTFGTMKLTEGYSMESVTKMLAKTNVQETSSIYASVTHQLIISQGLQQYNFSQQSFSF